MFTLTNKVALVTGGASGIGLAISQLFAQQGAYVHILELNQAQAQTVADELVQQGFQAEAHAVDVSKQADVVETIQAIIQKHPIGNPSPIDTDVDSGSARLARRARSGAEDLACAGAWRRFC